MTVAEKRSFKAAATELGRTQPSITLAIQQLEEAVGLKLVERTTRKVFPTSEGENFIPVAKRLIREFEVAVSDLVSISDGRIGHVSMAVMPSFAVKILPDIIKLFAEQHNGISVQISDGNSRQVQNRIIRNEVDFGIGSKAAPHQELDYMPLLQDQLELVCHKEHALAQHPGPLTWRDLKDHVLLDSGLHNMLSNTGITTEPKYEFSTTTTLFAMIKANIGIAVLPTLSAVSGSSDLVFKPISEPVIERDVCLVRRKDWSLSPAAELMVALIEDLVPGIVRDIKVSRVRPQVVDRNTEAKHSFKNRISAR